MIKIEKCGDLDIELIEDGDHDAIESDLKAFWYRENIFFSDELALERVHQARTIARNAAGEIVGVNTFFEDYNETLHNHFLHHRSMVAAEHRKSSVSVRLTTVAWEYFNKRFNDKIETKFIGVITKVENQNLIKYMTHAIWPYSNYVYFGSSSEGLPWRVWYFDNAKI